MESCCDGGPAVQARRQDQTGGCTSRREISGISKNEGKLRHNKTGDNTIRHNKGGKAIRHNKVVDNAIKGDYHPF
jgi:hypothetical protein